MEEYVSDSESPMVEISGIGKTLGKTVALQDVSLSVRRGELFGFVGPDGAGKTTLFRILATLLMPDKGKAVIDGMDVVTDFRRLRSKIGYMPGQFSLYSDLTVEENLQFFATVFHTTVKENYERIRDIYSQIEPFRNRRVAALSGGMKQKLALSCALVHCPDILLLDEPTTGVDPVSRREFWEILHRLKEQGITILVSTPVMEDARMCDRIAFMYEGKIMAVDSPDVVLHRFRSILCPDALDSVPVISEEEPAICVEGLTKCFGDFTAVDHISFSVKRGEVFGFLGANGAGKTTAMRMLCGLSIPTSGKGTVAGFDILTETEKIKQNIGYMSQRFSLYDDLKVWENIRLFAGIYGMDENTIRRRTDEILEEIGLTSERDSFVEELPLGWKQRLAFSVAVFHRPQIVFLDEPTGGVDPATRRQFWELIYQTAQSGITVFVTTHYMDEAEYCHRISMMVDGKIVALDTPDVLKKTYGAANLDDVFQQLARKSVRKAD